MTTNLLNDLSNVVEKGTSKEQVGNKLMAGVPCSEVGRISEEGAIGQPLSSHSAPFGIRWKPAGNKPSISMRSFTRLAAMVTLLLTLACGNVWGTEELANINFKAWTPQNISAGSTVNGCYFKSATTISAAKGATFGGNATTSSNWVAIPLSGINGSITITLTHASSRPQWKNYFKGLNAAPSSSDLSSNPSSVGDNTRPGSNTTTSSWTINTDKLYGVFYVGKGSNGLNDIYTITITTPDWTYYYRGADNDWGADAMTKSSEGFYSYKSSSTNDHQFKIAKSTSTWDYNHSFVDAGYLGTSITTIGDYGSDNCYIWSAPASYYIIVFRPGSAMNTTANPKICASATLPAEKFTISFNSGGGTGSMSSISNVVYGSEKATTANTFTKSGYRFTGWNANVDVKVGGATKTAGTLLDDEVTIQDIKSDITLTAQWEVDDGCNKIFWFAKAADATTNGVTNNTTTFSGVDTGTSGVSGSITIDGKTYSVTGRGSNNSTAITFTVPANKVGTLYGLANSSGSSARTLTLTNTDSYSETQSTSASSSTAGAFTFENMPAGSYSLAWSGNGAENMLCLKLCDAPAGCTAPTGLAAGSTTAKGTTFTVTDGEDTNDYEFYVSTSSTAPTSGSSATYTSTSKTKTITDCVAGTTYYAWVRSKCDVSSKSEWTALTGNTFTTSTVTVTHTLTNVTKTSGAATAGGSNYTAVYAAVSGYSLPTPTVTIDGNTATSGTDYTWTAGTGTLTIPANKINGNIVITLNSAAAAPSSVAIGDNWLWFAGETMTLTATPTGGNGPVTYQWYKGGKADGNAIEGATNATFSKTCAFEDAGSYYCKVTCGGTESTWGKNGDAYEVKIPRLYVKTGRNDGVKSDYGNVDFTRVDASTATASISLGSNWDYCFNIADGCGHYYGNAGTMQYNNYGPWVTNVNNQDCGLRTTNGATYVFTINYSNWTQLTTTVTFPSSNQAADKVIYFDNNDRQWSNLHYRIGRADHTQAAALTLVPGTANLYKYTTVAYNNFAGWHIANNSGWTGSNTIYRTYTNGDQYSITYATAHEGGAVTQAAVTVTPTTSRGAGSDAGINDNCTFYNYEITTGMKTQNVSITAPSNGTITVSYTDVNNAAQSFTSGNADLAHTVIITPTVTPATGYQLSGLTVNGNAHTPGNTYTVTGTTVVAATFTPQVYSITYKDQGDVAFSGTHIDSPSAHPTSHTYGAATSLNGATKDGYIFGGWFTTSACTGDAVTSLGATAYTADITLYAKWTLDSGCKTWAGTPSSWTDNKMTIGSTLELESFSAVINTSSNHEVWSGHTETVIALAGSGQYVQGHFTDGSNINTVTVSAANNQSAGNDYEYVIIFCANSSFSSGVTGQTHAAPSHADAQNDAKLVHEFTAPAGTKYFRIYRKVEAIGGYAGGGDGKTTRVYRIEVCPVLCTTPDAPTSPTNGATTSTTQAVSWTDAANSQWEVYVSTSSSTPGSGQTPTASPTTASYTFEGLTASTTYYWWVRSVCDASHKSSWVAGTSFTTAAAEPEALVTWQMKVDQAAWALKSGTTEDGTNITSIASTADEPGSTSTGITGTTGKVVMASGESNVDKAASFTFTVNSAKKVVPEKVTCKVLNVSSGNRTYKAQLSDNNGHVYYSTNTVSVTTENVLTDATFNFASSLVLTGNVTLKVYAWKTSDSPTQFRMGEYVKLFGEVQNAADYTVTHTMSNVTKSAGATSVKEGNNYTATYAGAGGYALPSTITVTIGGSPATAGTDYTWTQGTGVVTIPGDKVTGNIVITVTGVAIVHHDVTFSLTNVAYSSGDNQGDDAATEGSTFSTVFVGTTGYNLPSTISVTIDGDPATAGTDYTWTQGTGTLTIPGAKITGDITVSITGEEIPATKDIYYGHVKITDGALVREIPSGATQFFTNIGGTVANNTEISLSSTPSTTGMYYNSNNLTDAELSKSSNWSTSSGSNRYIRGLKFANGTTYTLALGSKVASSIKFYGWCGSASKTMTVGGEEYVSSATKNTFGTNTFVKSGGFTGNVSITQDGDFYGILVITIQTATPCTTPVIPTLSNQSLCEGTDIAEWDATQTAVLADGETVTYSWKKKGNDTELANTATFDLGSSATESQAGTYVVTVTVSKAGYASSSANKEVELTVTDGEEVTSIVADKATVYPGNSVTLTATANTPATWQWYTCTNSAGDGEDDIDGATSASYTIASAGAAGTYYYKAVATGSCGTAERVYTLTVTAASECQNYYWFIYADDATANGVINNRDGFFSNTTTGTGNTGTYTMTVDGTSMTGTKRLSTGAYKPKFTVPDGATATLYIYGKAASSDAGKHLVLKRTSDDEEVEVTSNTTVQGYTKENIEAGEWTLSCGSSNWCYSFFAVKVCSTSSCTDATPTIAAVNNTVCSGTKMRIDATGYETGATFKWQKLNTSTSSWDDVTGETKDSLVIASVTASNAGSYRFIATKGCARTSNTVTIAVPSAPNFGSTVPSSVSVMQTIALSINTVEATDATKYRWYKSADATWDAGDTEIGTNKELIKAYDGEAIGSPSYYVICRAQNSCGTTTSSAIAVNVTTYVEEDCATRGNEGDAEFSFENSGAGQGSYESTACWTMNSNSKILVYYPPTGKYFKTAKVTIASSSESKASYNWSTNGGTDYTAVSLTVSSTLTERTIDLSAHGNVNAFQIGRNFDSKGSSGGTLYVSKICFEYTEACTATTVTPSTASTSYEMGGAWSNPTFTLSPAAVSGETLTYSSSNEDIASVDDDGTVTFNGEAGTVTITASYAGGTISETEYCASSGSYTITVSCPGGAPTVVADGSVDMSGCNTSVTLHAKKQDGTAFADGTYQWFRNGEEIDGATSSSYTATQAGTYTVERTNGTGCTTPSTNSAIVTSETTEPEVERLVPFQYYHVDKTYTDQMKMRHLFAVKNSGKLDGKSFKMYVSRSGGAATDVTSSNALVVVPNGDGHVDTVMVDLNKLSGKYSEDDELVFTCKAIDCSGNVSDVYKNTITMRVIGATPTLALICSGSSKAEGTRKTGELTVGGDFLTGYNVADLCQQTGNTSFDANTEWGLYTELKEEYIVTPVNGYAPFNKLNYEPFDILFLTDYPKASKSDAAKDILDDMAALCDYRPLFSFKTHMVAKSPSKWAAKGFTTSATENKADGRLNLNIVCYAHPMFDAIKTGDDVYNDTENTSAPLIYTMLSGTGHEGNKGMQGFEIAAAENFVTIGLTHYNAEIEKVGTDATWTPGSEDRMLVTVAERQTNIEARMILFSLNAGAHSKLTDKGEQVVLACLSYLLDDDPLHVADCSFTFDNGASNEHNAAWYAEHCPGCTGTAGDGKWSTAANWAPDYRLLPGEFTSVRIAAPVTVDLEHAHVLDARIKEGGQIIIPAGKGLDMKGTIRRLDGSEISPTENEDIFLASNASGNGSLIFNNDKGDSKATVAMYTTAKADPDLSAANSTWQYIGTPHNDVAIATYNYYDSWLYQYDTDTEGWTVIPNGGPLVPFRGYCVTHPETNHTFVMYGKLTATTNADINVPAGKYVVAANSWVAPIDINAIEDDDMEGITDKTIYFFNTGTDTEGENGTGTAAGTYRATPIHAASYTGDWQIPSMQGFYVVGGSSAGALHLDYSKHVRPSTVRAIKNNPMYAPRRAKAVDTEEPLVLKMFARGRRYHDKLVVLERADFTTGYDSGWDGEAWGGSDLSPQVYVIGGGRYDAVSAIPDFEGTVVAFRAGEDEEYTIDFIYDAENEPLYLFDTENNSYTQIVTGGAYHFTTSDKSAHSRFILTRHAPQIATGCENLDGGEGAKAKKLIIEDKMFIMVNGLLYDATGKVVK